MKKIISITAIIFLALVGCKKEDFKNCKITKITITKLPSTDTNGASWDISDGPDVFINITADGTNVLTTSTANNNINYPISWNLANPLNIENLSVTYNILAYDEDGISSDDYISGISFKPDDFSKKHKSHIDLSNSKFEVTLDVQWY